MGPPALALIPLLVFGAAAAAAAVTGVGTYFLLSAGQDGGEGFEALGWALLGAIVAVIVGLTVTVVGLIVLARRLFLPGHRVAPVVLALVGPFVPLALGGALTALFSGNLPVVLGVPLTLAALAAPSIAFLWCGSAAPSQRTLLRGGAVLAAVIAVGSLVLYVMKDAREDKAIEDLPLVLFDGTTAEAPYPNWKRDAFTRTAVRSESAFAPDGHEAYLKYFSAPGVVFITMRTEVGECSPTLLRGYTCQVVGSLPAGELRSYRSPEQHATYPESREFLVLVYADGSGVSVNVDGLQQPAQDVLARLQRVDRKTFDNATRADLSVD
ncbi:MAG: hypothetical protein ABJA81_01355 [Nocardioidaceae bacterium]